MSPKIIFFVATLALALTSAYFFNDVLNFETIKASQNEIAGHLVSNYFFVLASFFMIYVLVTAFSIPGAAVLTLLAGAIFGLPIGTLVVSFASTAGATLSFLMSRYLLKNSVEEKFGDKIKKFKEGIEKDGAFFLFTLRLVPVVPFFIINLVMGLTPIKTQTFWWVSQVGMLAGTLVYVNAGTQLSELESMSGILSPDIVLSLVLLGFFPLASKKLIDTFNKK